MKRRLNMDNEVVVLLKLKASFAEIICKVENDEVADSLIEKTIDKDNSAFEARSPFMIQMHQDPRDPENTITGLHALSLLMKGEPKDVEIVLDASDILFAAKPTDDVEKAYRQKVSTIQLV